MNEICLLEINLRKCEIQTVKQFSYLGVMIESDDSSGQIAKTVSTCSLEDYQDLCPADTIAVQTC